MTEVRTELIWVGYGCRDRLKRLRGMHIFLRFTAHHSLVINEEVAEEWLLNAENRITFHKLLRKKAAYELCFNYSYKMVPILQLFTTFTCYGKLKLVFSKEAVVISEADVDLWQTICKPAHTADIVISHGKRNYLFYERLYQIVREGFKEVRFYLFNTPMIQQRRFLMFKHLSLFELNFADFDTLSKAEILTCLKKAMSYLSKSVKLVVIGSVFKQDNALLFHFPLEDIADRNIFDTLAQIGVDCPFFVIRREKFYLDLIDGFKVNILDDISLKAFLSNIYRGTLKLTDKVMQDLISNMETYITNTSIKSRPKKFSLNFVKNLEHNTQAKKLFLRQLLLQC